jgi:RNA polymerase sigma factor (sigma-70 family)
MTPLELFEKHKGWALAIAKFKAHTQNLHAYRDDLKQAALLGLWKASVKYNPIIQPNFKTYAFMRVLGEMRDMLRSFDWLKPQ